MTDTAISPRAFFKVEWALVGIVITVILQGGSIVWFAAQMDQRLSVLEEKVRLDGPGARSLAETLAKVDERSAGTAKAVERIEGRLDELIRAK